MNTLKWTKEKCLSVAIGCISKSEMKRSCSPAYSSALKHGWINDYIWFRNPHEKWDEDACLIESKKYSTVGEFSTKSPSAYSSAKKHGWINNYTWLTSSNRKTWDYERCYQYAKKYKTLKDFKNSSPSTAYTKARKNGWIKDYTWFTPYECKYTKNECYKIAKNYKTHEEFKTNSPYVYRKSRENGWLSDYTWLPQIKHPKAVGYWDNYEHCYEEAKKYNSRSDFQRNCSGGYKKSIKNNWIDDFIWFNGLKLTSVKIYCIYVYEDKKNKHVYVGLTKNIKRRDREHRAGKKKHGIVKYDTVYKYFNNNRQNVPEVIVLKKDLTAKEAQQMEEFYYNYYDSNGWKLINKAKPGSLGAYTKWTKEDCCAESKKYKTIKEFAKENGTAYNFARENNLINDFYWLERRQKYNGYWTFERCLEEAKKYSFKNNFIINSPGAYNSALRNGWLKNYTWLKLKRNPPGYWTFERCLEEAKKYGSIFSLKNNCYGAYNKIVKHKWTKQINELLK
jgi:predicted GIY-YIG superfamily endonuclease